MEHLELAALEAGLDEVRRSPKADGKIELIVRRPAENAREIVGEGQLDEIEGLIGDGWHGRGSRDRVDGAPHPGRQITLMNARAAALIAGPQERWGLAGDQLYVDLDLSGDNLPPRTKLQVGSAVVEVTGEPHRGCKKFAARFGLDGLRFVNSEVGYALNLRGINARVVGGGAVRTGDVVSKLP